jgi:hypothetical protein
VDCLLRKEFILALFNIENEDQDTREMLDMFASMPIDDIGVAFKALVHAIRSDDPYKKKEGAAFMICMMPVLIESSGVDCEEAMDDEFIDSLFSDTDRIQENVRAMIEEYLDSIEEDNSES